MLKSSLNAKDDKMQTRLYICILFAQTKNKETFSLVNSIETEKLAYHSQKQTFY